MSISIFDIVYDFSEHDHDGNTIGRIIDGAPTFVYDTPPPEAQRGLKAIMVYIRNPELLIPKIIDLVFIFLLIFLSCLWASLWTQKGVQSQDTKVF